MTCLCDHLIIYHRGRQCFHKLPRPGAARAGINSRLSPNTQLLITVGEGWPDVARRGTLGPRLAGGREGWHWCCEMPVQAWGRGLEKEPEGHLLTSTGQQNQRPGTTLRSEGRGREPLLQVPPV